MVAASIAAFLSTLGKATIADCDVVERGTGGRGHSHDVDGLEKML